MRKSSIANRAKKALEYARQRKAENKNWLEAHNALFGLGGKCGELFPTRTERTAFAKSKEYLELNEMLSELPDPQDSPSTIPLSEASGNLHVRLPRSLHAALRAEADAENISLNQLIVSKLFMQLCAVTAERN